MKTKSKILSAMVLGASLLLSNQTNAQFWNLIGNSGTNEAANFVGTLDTMGLTFRTANATRMRIVGNRAADIAAGRSGFIGIGTTAPTSKLHVVGSILSTDNVVATDTLRGARFHMPTGAVNGRFLRCDAAGNASWAAVTFTETDPQVGVIATSRVPRWNGTSLVSGTIWDNATNVGIGTAAPTQKLHVVGNILASGNVNATSFIGSGNIDVSGYVGFGSVEQLTDGGVNTIASNSNFVPTTNNVRDLGTSLLKWNDVFAGGNVSAASFIGTGNIDVSGYVGFGSVEQLTDGGNNTIASNSSIVPTTDNVRDLGTPALRWNNIYAGGQMDICGTIRATEIRVETGWCDYVFDKNYKLRSLSEVEEYINENKHLPDVTPGAIIEGEGLEVGKVSSQMIRKIEELTLYMIQLEKENKDLHHRLEKLENK